MWEVMGKSRTNRLYLPQKILVNQVEIFVGSSLWLGGANAFFKIWKIAIRAHFP